MKVGDIVTCTHYLDGIIGQIKEINNNRIIIKLVQPITQIEGDIEDFKKIPFIQ